jgi:hypothetical protein
MMVKNAGILIIILMLVNAINTDERVIKDVNISMINEINLSEYDMFLPQSLDMDSAVNIAFFDRGLSKIAIKNSNDNSLITFGEGKGRGPREFQRIWDLELNEEGEIFLTDMDKQKIIKWNILQEFKEELDIEERFVRPSRFTLCKDDKIMYVLSAQYGRKGIISKFDMRGKHLMSFLKIDSHEKRLPYYTDGEMACDDNGNLYYTGRFTNVIRKYNSNGKVVFDREVFGFEGNEKITEKDGMFTTIAKDVKRATGEVYIINENLLVAFSGRKDGLLKVIDIYSTTDGAYKYSFELPNLFESFTISDDRIATFEKSASEDIKLCIYSYSGISR